MSTSLLKSFLHTGLITKKFKLQHTHLWSSKRTFARLRVSAPLLEQAARAASNEKNNLIKFCNNVVAAHRSRAFRGKPAIWDFMRDVVGNLNKANKGNRY